jgi:hypothetical protein
MMMLMVLIMLNENQGLDQNDVVVRWMGWAR